MAARAIASLSLSFGLVSIPVKLYSATEQAAALRFKMMGRGGARLRQQYVLDVPPADTAWTGPRDDPERDDAEDPERDDAEDRTPRPQDGRWQARGRSLQLVDEPAPAPAPAVREAVAASPQRHLVERADMVKGYEFEPGKFVLFTAAELKALQASSRQTIDIVSFIPERSVDPVYYDKAYYLAPHKGSARTYSLLLAAMRDSGRCALARWAWRSKEYVVEIRAAEGGLVLQQLLYADEVRSIAGLHIERVPVGQAELKLALQLIAQISDDSYDPQAFVDEEKRRILAAVEQKVAGRQVAVAQPGAPTTSGQVVDLIAALQASLRPSRKASGAAGTAARAEARKPARRTRSAADKAAKDGRAGEGSAGARTRARR